MKRENGYYWVKSKFGTTGWVVAEWLNSSWFIGIHTEDDDHWEKIDERRIVRNG